MENGLIQIMDGERINLIRDKRNVNYKASPIIITLLMDLIKCQRYKWIMDRASISKNNGLEKTKHVR